MPSSSAETRTAIAKLPKSKLSPSPMSSRRVASRPPTTEPDTPRRTVHTIPIPWRPGTSSRAMAPTKKPQTIQETKSPMGSLPLDRARRLRRDVEDHPVHLRDLVDHPRGDAFQQVVGQPCPVGRHRVVTRDSADDDDVPVGALVALHANRAQVAREDAERLPQL